MAIGVVTDADFNRELEELTSLRSGKKEDVTDDNTDDLSPSGSPDSISSNIHQDDKQDVLEGQIVLPMIPLTTPASQGQIETMARRGRSEGDNNVPDSLRKLIAEEQLMNGRPAALKLAKQFGISPSSVSAYANGSTSTTTYDKPSNSILTHLNKSRERAVKRASKTLNQALSAITQDKLDYADATDLSGIAKDMSVIIKNLEPKSVESTPDTGPQFVIFAPSFRQENSFETIEVKE